MQDLFSQIPGNVIEEIQDLNLNIKSENCNHEVNSLLQRTVLIGGKRLRPLLTYLFGNLFQVPLKAVGPYACAIELVHAASLSHDDVVDNATTRRGLPSINALATNKRAVLAGDYLLADVIVDLSKQGHLKLVQEMAQVISALAEGEWLQLDASESRKYSQKIIEEIALCKTASVMSWCCISPAYLKEVSPQIVEYCRSFGENLGIAFQLMDDTLDFSGSSKKDHNLDLENGIVNSVIFEWLELNPELKEKFESGDDIQSLWNQNKLETALQIVKDRAHAKLDKCYELLDIISTELSSDDNKTHIETAKKPIEFIIKYLGKREF